MSKAVLIMDMPECCGRCQLMDDDASGGYCRAYNDDYIDIPDTMGGKPDWCPLRELPEKKTQETSCDNCKSCDLNCFYIGQWYCQKHKVFSLAVKI